MQDLNLRPVASSSKTTSAKPIPTPASLDPWDFNYIPSPDGKDANLMIMFHGLGDVKESFTGLGKTLNLPSTAVLALQAPDRLPLIEEPGYVWYNTFGPMFEMLPLEQQTASTAIPKLRNLLTALTGPAFGWELSQIHLFGWVQGGTMALELAYDIGKNGLDVPSGPSGSMVKRKRFASVTTVCATLLSFPTSNMLLPTPVCYFTRQDLRASKPARELNLVRRAFKDVSVVEMPKPNSQNMPEGFSEWKGIMQFWSTVLVRADEGWKGEGEVYEVVQ